MIEKIIELSIKNKFLVILGTLFIILGGTYALLRTPLDAIPDLSDVQVIIFTEYPGQAPQVVEDQVTYPLTTAMLAVPFAKVVRGYSFFGFSFVYIIFEDGTDMYWAVGIPQLRCRPAAARGDSVPGTGCHRRGLGLRVHSRKRPA
jgi:Cu(I)/Ag(I) efflux system membrane protein CusA/SilA